MKAWVAGLACVLAVAVAGCGGGGSGGAEKADTPSTTAKPTTTTTGPKVLTNDQMVPALLTVQDLPTGWADYPTKPEAIAANPTGGPCNGPNFYARLDNAHAVGRVTRSFAKDAQIGPFLSIDIASFPTVADAESFMAATKVTNSACTTFTAPSPNSPKGIETFTVGGLSITKLGDDTLAVRRSSDNAGGLPYSSDNVYVRSGNLVLSVLLNGTTSDTAFLASTAATQLERAHQLTAG